MAISRTQPAGAAAKGAEAFLGRLSLTNFRNFDRLEQQFPEAGAAIVGPNGAGKTNLLEAIYYLEIFRSFRGANDRELVRFGESVFRIEAEVGGAGEVTGLAAAYRKAGGGAGRRKKVEVDGREVDRLSDAIGTLGAVVFSLDDVEIVRGSPGGRRRFVNILLSLVEPGYVDALQRYRNVLSQRNEALKEESDPSLLGAWTRGLVEEGAKIAEARDRWVRGRAEAFSRYNAAVSGGDPAAMSYDPSLGWPDGMEADGTREPGARARERRRERWAERFEAALAESAKRERRRGVTVVGPHRDDLAFRSPVAGDEERDLRTYGSGGQQRTAALALRLVEADTLGDRLGREPVYLLDDVFAELDRDRSARVTELLDEGRSGQVIVAAPKEADVSLRNGGLEAWRIRDGELISG